MSAISEVFILLQLLHSLVRSKQIDYFVLYHPLLTNDQKTAPLPNRLGSHLHPSLTSTMAASHPFSLQYTIKDHLQPSNTTP